MKSIDQCCNEILDCIETDFDPCIGCKDSDECRAVARGLIPDRDHFIMCRQGGK